MKHVVLVLALVALCPPSLGAQQPPVLDDAAIRAILTQRIDTERKNVGIVVGVIEPASERVIAHGVFAVNDPRPVGADTVFEIGSITKVFTSMLLGDMIERAEVGLDDPVAKYLPPAVRVPDKDGRAITLVDLSTHTSGLPRLPGNLVVTNIDNPYADYSVTQLYEFLSGYTLPRAVGSQFEYSNLGAGLLGHALSRRAETDYESVVRSRILAPLKMTDTAIGLTPELRSRLARGHNQRREPVGNWDLPALAGAGALRSTTRDMLRFLAAFTSPQPHALSPAVARLRSVERPGAPGGAMALGWQIARRPDSEILFHGGMTGGYAAFVGYVPSRRIGVVVLSNMLAGVTGVDDIGLHLLDPRLPLSRPPAQRTRITLPAEALKPFVGRYELRPGFVATVTQEGARLFVQPANQQRHEVFAEGPRSFFATIADAQFTFDVDASGRATSMTLHQGGAQVAGKRLPDDAAAEAPKPPRPRIAMAADVLQPYVGRYQLNAAMSVVVSREDARLFAQAAGQSRFELFAESVDRFFAEAGGIEIAFDRDGDGRVPSFTIRQGGAAFQLKRVE